MKRLPLLTLAAAVLLIAPACKKDQTAPQPTTPTTEQQLADKTWAMTSATPSPSLQTTNGTTVTDVFPYVPSCTQDDTQQFVSGGVFKADEGATKCDGADPQTVTGTWTSATSGASTTLTVVISGTTLHFKVLSVSDTSLQLSTQDDFFHIGTGTNVTYTLTFKKK